MQMNKGRVVAYFIAQNVKKSVPQFQAFDTFRACIFYNNPSVTALRSAIMFAAV
jgi:hypothetical protein